MRKTSSRFSRVSTCAAGAGAKSSYVAPTAMRETSRRSQRALTRVDAVRLPAPAGSDGRPTSGFQPRVEIGSLLDTRLRLRGVLTLDMEREGDSYVATCSDLNEFGYGSDPTRAIEDARRSIAELYWSLKENQHRLGPDLARTWQMLSELIYEV